MKISDKFFETVAVAAIHSVCTVCVKRNLFDVSGYTIFEEKEEGRVQEQEDVKRWYFVFRGVLTKIELKLYCSTTKREAKCCVRS